MMSGCSVPTADTGKRFAVVETSTSSVAIIVLINPIRS